MIDRGIRLAGIDRDESFNIGRHDTVQVVAYHVDDFYLRYVKENTFYCIRMVADPGE